MSANITNNLMHKVRRKDLIEPELSYRVVGTLYRVFNELGPGLHEKYYQRAVAELLREEQIPFKKQVTIPLSIANKVIGKYIADIIVDGKIILELKRGLRINRIHATQLFAYLKTTNLPLGILVYFGNDGVFFKRIINKELDPNKHS